MEAEESTRPKAFRNSQAGKKEQRAREAEESEQKVRALSEEILLGMNEWRKQHPKATLREIEAEVSHQMSRLGAQLIQATAHKSAAADWTSEAKGEGPRCPQCGSALVSRGKRSRRLQSSGGAEVELLRSYGTCPTCGVGLFPPG